MNKTMTTCPECRGRIENGTTKFTAKVGDGILILEGVPADICTLCGEEWFSDEVAKRIENIASDARKRHVKFEVIKFDVA